MTTPLTSELLGELREAEALATKGPYKVREPQEGKFGFHIVGEVEKLSRREAESSGYATSSVRVATVIGNPTGITIARDNAQFIALACTLAPAMLDEITALRQRVAELEAVVAKLPRTKDGVIITPDLPLYFLSPVHEIGMGGAKLVGFEVSEPMPAQYSNLIAAQNAYSTEAAALAARKEVTQ